MNLNDKLAVVFALVGDLKNHGIESIVAGGCSRDIYHGKDPKDFDIIVPGSAPAADVAALLTPLVESGKATNYKFFPMYAEADSDRIEWVFKVTIAGVDLDIIRYAIDTVVDAPDYFDFNLNQYVTVEFPSGVYGTIPCWKDDPKDGLVAIRGDHTERREAYVKAKWEEFYGSNGQ